MTDESWHWQEPETAWRGIGIYHITLVVSSRDPLLGTLIIPDNDPKQARVDLKPLGEKVKACVRMIPELHPEIQIIGIRLMPDHVHFILYVRRSMPDSIKNVVRGFWQGAKKQGRLYTLSINPNTIRDNEQRLDPIFSDYPFIRPMSRRGQLDAMMQYIKLNPQRLATKRLKPGYFYVQENVEIGDRIYCAVGNIQLLHAEKYAPVHVRSVWVKDAEQNGNVQPLKDYKNGCVLAARDGTVMVSPYISEHEKAVLDVLLKEKHPIIYIADNGFGRYFKPSDALFDAVAEGRLLMLSPWSYDPSKKRASREECVAMNAMAENICDSLSPNSIRKN